MSAINLHLAFFYSIFGKYFFIFFFDSGVILLKEILAHS